MDELVFIEPFDFTTSWYPFSSTRSASELLWGGLTLRECWANQIQSSPSTPSTSLCLNPLWIPSDRAAYWACQLTPGLGWKSNGVALAEVRYPGKETEWNELPEDADILKHPTDLFLRCGEAIASQWRNIASAMDAKARTDWPSHVTFTHGSNEVLAGNGVVALACTFNTEKGPIIIGEHVTIEEGAHLRGPLVIGAHTVIKMGCRLSGPSAIGKDCRLGGEISNVVIHSHSNKGHDGFLGNSVLGSWCNLGAGTNSSNLKSNYSPVRLWSEQEQRMVDSELQFCGVLMGDHAKSSINASFNTATTVGPAAQILGTNFPPKHIPAFSWVSDSNCQPYDFDRFVATTRAVMARRGIEPTSDEIECWRALHRLVHG